MAEKRVAQCVVLAVALVYVPASVQVQAFPTGPLSIVVSLAPGGAADISARAMGEGIQSLLNTPVRIVNRPGGGGTRGA